MIISLKPSSPISNPSFKMFLRSIDELGTEYWRDENGNLHREDGPAVTFKDGTSFWYRNNELHREDGPAIIRPDGTKEWYLNHERHCDYGPAIIHRPDIIGGESWCIEGHHLIYKDVQIAKKILSGELFHQIPLYLNHRFLKYFCQTALKGSHEPVCGTNQPRVPTEYEETEPL